MTLSPVVVMVLIWALVTVWSCWPEKKKPVVRVRTGRPLRILNPRRLEGMQPQYLHWDVRKNTYVNLLDEWRESNPYE